MPSRSMKEAEIQAKQNRGQEVTQRDLIELADAQKRSEVTYGQTSSKFSGVLPTVIATASSLGQDEHLAHADHAHGVGTAAIPSSILTEQGDIIYASAVGTPAALPHGTAGDVLISGGDGANPSWTATPPPAIADDSITFSKLQHINLDVILGSKTAAGSPHNPEEIAVAEGRIVGRKTGGHITDLTANDALGILGQVSISANGYCPAAPNDTAKFFRGDATWDVIQTATSSVLGIAKFSTDNFAVSSGNVTIKDEGVALAELVHASATDKILGRSAAGAGDWEEIACTAAGRALLDDANAAAQLTTLGASPAFTYLTAPLTSTSWDGDAYSTTAKTVIDLSAVFSVPAGVKAVLVELQAKDSASSTTACNFRLSPNATATDGPLIANVRGRPDDIYEIVNGLVPCDASGDIYYQAVATGASTLDVVIRIWGYQT
jgi:hypothetical protein